ncbi:MAG TPA: hypothetical protein VGG83_16555 [Trebonia sp.]|jgi:hypothetical protein
MAETRRCERCGKEFEPKREHARFCSARCRVAWNRENWSQVNRVQQKWGSENWADERRGPRNTGISALSWALTAMHDTTERLGKVRASDRAQAFAVIGEAVWWVTIVDATLFRYYAEEYDASLVGLSGQERQATETTFAGLRFVRNRMGYHADHADFIQPCADGSGGGDAPITEWTWRSLPVPAVATLPPRGQEWELSRYEAYQELLAGHSVGETFGRTADFHDLVVRTARAAARASADTPSDQGEENFSAE